MRVVAAAWAGVLAGFVPGIGLDLPVLLGIAIGVAVAAAVLALPVSRSRRAPVDDRGAATESCDSRRGRARGRSRSRTSGERRCTCPPRRGRKTVGYGPVFGSGLRWTWEVPDPNLGVVRIDRGRGGLDIDVATARPDELARALGAPPDR